MDVIGAGVVHGMAEEEERVERARASRELFESLERRFAGQDDEAAATVLAGAVGSWLFVRVGGMPLETLNAYLQAFNGVMTDVIVGAYAEMIKARAKDGPTDAGQADQAQPR